MKRIYALVVMIGLVAGSTFAQGPDVHFSQFHNAPIHLNPAFAGLNNCDFRLAANYKSQWNGAAANGGFAFRTIAASYDMSIGKPTAYSNYLGLGVSLFSDFAGDVSYNTHRVDLSLAYHILVNRSSRQTVTLALTGGAAQRSIDQNATTFDSQWSSLGFDPNGDREFFDKDSYIFGDVGVGALWNFNPTDVTNYFVGASVTHLNQPNQSFYNDQVDRLYLKFTLHGGAQMPLSDKVFAMPAFLLLRQGPSHELLGGGYLKYKLGTLPTDRNSVSVGGFYRFTNVSDAVVAAMNVNIKRFTIGVSYDINLSKAAGITNMNGGPEIALIYTGCINRAHNKIFCPALN